MKHKLIFLASLLMAAMSIPAIAQYNSSQLKNPDEATYAITGTMQITRTGGTPTYELLDPQGSRRNGGYIKFGQRSHYYGTAVDGEQVRFSLENAETNRPGKFSGQMVFWSWNDAAGEWQIDIESGSGRSEYESATFVNFMLVLDCSGSMQAELGEMKNSAKYFLRKMLEVSDGKGNIRIGVIGFSTVEYSRNHTQEPLPLTRENYDRLCTYIDRLNDGGGTALWYSINAAAECLQRDYNQNLKGKSYAGAAVIAFTDGHDNTSNDETYVSSKEYYNYTLSHFPSQTVNGQDITSWIVGLRGADITSDNIWLSTIGQFKKVADNFVPISRIDQLHEEFDKIAEALIERNTVLNLRVAKGISGRVGWTYPEEKVVVSVPDSPKPKQPSKFWMGLGGELGFGYHSKVYYGDDEWYQEEGTNVGLAARADAAFPLSKHFALGGTLSLGFTIDDGIVYRLGPLAKFTFSNESALLIGFGVQNWAIEESYAYLTLGWKFSSPWYINATINGPAEMVCFGIGYSVCGGK